MGSFFQLRCWPVAVSDTPESDKQDEEIFCNGYTTNTIKNLEKFAPVVAFVFEPVQGEGGINIPDAGFLRELIDYLRARGIYIIADEVQTGFGRTGKMFACEHFGVKPDMVVLSKSLGAGLALGAVVVNDDMFPDLEPGMHSGSHLADPMAVAAAIANIDMILSKIWLTVLSAMALAQSRD